MLKRRLNSTRISPGITFVAPSPAVTLEIWKLVGGGYGPEGKYSWTSTLVRQDKGKLAEKDIKIIIAGETQTEPDCVWVKEPAKKK